MSEAKIQCGVVGVGRMGRHHARVYAQSEGAELVGVVDVRPEAAAAIVEVARITAGGLSRYFAVERPRLMVAGLNPHAGEHGLMGDEDERVIRPAVEALVATGIDAVGPVSADTMFHAEARAGYDAAICMYHDQALIPIKALAFDHAVNVTLGQDETPPVVNIRTRGRSLDCARVCVAQNKTACSNNICRLI